MRAINPIALLLLSLLASASSAEPRPPWITSQINGSPHPPSRYKITEAFPKIKFSKPSCIEEIPGANRLFITEIGGKLFSLRKHPEVEKADIVLDLSETIGSRVSVFDADFHPQFRQNRQLYLCYVSPEQGRTNVSRFILSDTSPPTIDAASEEVILSWPNGGHNGGCLEFGKDGYLYISTGDGSGPNPPDGFTTGQDLSDLLGAVLRINVDDIEAEQTYSIPSDNPFVNLSDARPEVWAYGLRNPWKFGIDQLTGNVFAADNGWETWEMVHRLDRGTNCGWPVMEGRAMLRRDVKVGPTPISPPIKDHHHSEANSVIGGPVYRGSKLPDLYGAFIYGDYITGTIWALRAESDESYSHQTLIDTDQRITSFTEGSKGELYLLDFDYTGKIYELSASGLPDTSADFPQRLSETGLFTSLADLEPSAGVVPYEVRVPRWMDGASAKRWIAIPGDSSVDLTSHGKGTTYPNGTVLVKHLSLADGERDERINLETQLLHFEDGNWRPYSYLWNNDGTDATLVDSIGANRSLQVTDESGVQQERTWRVSATNECKLCHNAGSRFVLGFVANQLENQLSQLTAQTILLDTPPVPAESRLVSPHDPQQDLDDRARSYLHANCSMCHHPGGNAIVSFYLRRDLPFEKLNTNKGTGIGTFGIQNAKLITPGNPYRSVLMYRMSKLGYARMPYIGSQLVDSKGVALVSKWISSLPPTSTARTSASTQANSPDGRALATLVQDQATNRKSRDAAIQTLLQSTEGSLALVAQLHSNNLSKSDKASAVTLGGETANKNISGLFETFLPESRAGSRLGANIDPSAILELQGDPTRGKLIFHSDGTRCKACHDPRDKSKSIGTTLVDMNIKYKQPAEILQQVLNPSLRIDESLVSYLVLTERGKTVTGLLEKQTDDHVIIKTAEQKRIQIPREEIEEMRKSSKSLMPDQILSDLSAQEAADLLAYIRSFNSSE